MIPMFFRYTRYTNCRRATLLSFVFNNALVSFFVLYFSLQLLLLFFGVGSGDMSMDVVAALFIGSVVVAWALKLLSRHYHWTDQYYKHCTQNRKG